MNRSIAFAGLVALLFAGCGRTGGGGGGTPEADRDLPHNNTNLNENESVTMGGSGSGPYEGTNAPGEPLGYSGGDEFEPGELHVVNDSGMDIAELYITECDSDDWGPNELGSWALEDGWFFALIGLPAGCYDIVAFDASLDVGWLYTGANITEENPWFTLFLLAPPQGDDDDVVDDDDDTNSDDDDDVVADDDDDDATTGDDDDFEWGTLEVWNKSSYAFVFVEAINVDTEESVLFCEELYPGESCGDDVPSGTYFLFGDDWEGCWIDSDWITVGAGEDVDYYLGNGDVQCDD